MNTLNKTRNIHFSNQRGSSLIIGLVFLLIMTIIGLYASRSSSLELRMAGNAGAKVVSFENAEDARMDAEDIVIILANNLSAGTAYDCTLLGNGYFARAGEGTDCTVLVSDTLSWDATDSIVNPNNGNARYAIEYLGLDKVNEVGDDVEIGTGETKEIDVYLFRVVGRGTEASGSASTVETIFVVRKS